ncbi:MAG: tannase/feruloyl esterase family alpha/beta hydrolase [Maricaulaceae bacterium]|jgi:feruloyl esterase
MKSEGLRSSLALAVSAALVSCATEAASPSAPERTIACADMVGFEIEASDIDLPTNGAVITSAEHVPASEGGAAGPGRRPTGPQPAHCRVEGSILPIDPDAPTIDFAVAAPDDWNGGSWHMGGAGVNGSIPRLTGVGAGSSIPGSPSLLLQGYAVYGGDSGHQGRETDWVRNRESWMNFAYEGLKKTNDAAQAVIEALEGRRADVRYFSGGSQGGREGLEVIARYPNDYEGVVSLVPLAYFQGLMNDKPIKAAVQALPGAWIPPSKQNLVDRTVVALCDGLDNLEDGVIGDPVGCASLLDVDVSATPLRSLRCPSGGDEGDHCLSDPQLETVNALHTPVEMPYTLPTGKDDWPGWGPGAESGLLSRLEPDVEAGVGDFGIGAGVQRQLFGGSSDFDLYEFDLMRFRSRIEDLSRELDVPADWSDWFDHGGKLIWVTGAADVISNPRAQMRLYDDIVAVSGQERVDASVRFYVVPMGDHGATSRSVEGQVMPSRWNPAGALRDWVEHDVAPPDAPVVASYEAETITATRPICRYPAYPHYIGGDANWAAAFGCRLAP